MYYEYRAAMKLKASLLCHVSDGKTEKNLENSAQDSRYMEWEFKQELAE
jgi:hypothetical protein